MLPFDFLHEYLYWGYVLYLFGILGTNARSLGPFLDLLIHIIDSRRSLKFPKGVSPKNWILLNFFVP